MFAGEPCTGSGACFAQAECNPADKVTGGGGEGSPFVDLLLTLSHPIEVGDIQGWYAGTPFEDSGD